MKLLIALLTGFVIICSGKESGTSVDERTLIADPVIKQGHRRDILDGLKPDAKILELIESYHATGRNWNEEEREKLFGLPKEKVLEQLLLILESDDLLIWKNYDFNPSNGASSKNVYTTVLTLLLERYGTKRECVTIQKFLSKLLKRDTKNHLFFTTKLCCEFLGKFPEDSSIPVLVKALDNSGKYSIWVRDFRGKDKKMKLDTTYNVKGEALHALELIAGDQVSSYKLNGKKAPVSTEPKDIWIIEAKKWFSTLN